MRSITCPGRRFSHSVGSGRDDDEDGGNRPLHVLFERRQCAASAATLLGQRADVWQPNGVHCGFAERTKGGYDKYDDNGGYKESHELG